jgi:hypothetical protein
MKRIEWRAAVAAIAIGIGMLLATGCSKKEEAVVEETPVDAEATAAVDAAAPVTPAPVAAPTAPAGGEVLPGASSVREALAKKDYETAVGGLLALRGAATGQERYEAYLALYGEVIDTLRVEQSTDRKAAQALAQLNLATRGR